MRGHAGAAREWLEDEASAAATLRLVGARSTPRATRPRVARTVTEPATSATATITPLRAPDGIIYAW